MKLAWHGDRIEFIHVRFKLADEGSAPLSTVLERSLPPLSLISLRSFLLPIGLRFLLDPCVLRPTRHAASLCSCKTARPMSATNCMLSRACHSCILCADRTLCRSAPGLNLCLMARYEAAKVVHQPTEWPRLGRGGSLGIPGMLGSRYDTLG